MGLLKTAGRVAVASSVHGRVQRRQHQRWAAQDAQLEVMAAGPPPPPPPPAPAVQAPVAAPVAAPADMSAQMDLLRQLGELRDSGILSDEEFEAKKAKILAS